MLGAAGFSTANVGIYALAAALGEGALQLSVVVQNNINPMLAGHLANGEPAEAEALVRRTRKWFVPSIIVACVLGAALYPFVIPVLTGDSAFTAGSVPFAILMAGLALASPFLPFREILFMGNRPAWHTVLMVLVVATNFVANLALIPLLGLRGSAAASAIAVIASAWFVRRLARSHLGVKL
jgi:O-antigen/teichoic acid export membrane protein